MVDHVSRDLARDLCRYIEASPSPYHAVLEAARRLDAAGFTAVDEGEAWELAPGGRHYLIRGGGSLVAFVVGAEAPAAAGFSLIGSHTDSPNLRLKVRAAYASHGCGQLAVDIYGGVLLHTWLDRDLGIAGRVTVADDGAAGGCRSLPVRIDRPIGRVTSLAIHLDREVNDKGLKLNKQTHMPPIFSLAEGDGDAQEQLRALLQEAAGPGAGPILGHDLCLYEVNPPRLGGANDELVFAPRLDNLASVHASVTALVAVAAVPVAQTRVIALFDHEEIGSVSSRGAASGLVESTLRRLVEGLPDGRPSAWERAIARSFCLSADMAHAIHPNFADKHDTRHHPLLGRGPVIKTNVNQRYATDGETSARFRALCRRLDVPTQEFINRSDLACGSTIGPITAAELGMATVDIGNPMLSMHSAREMAGAADVPLMIRAMEGFMGSAG